MAIYKSFLKVLVFGDLHPRLVEMLSLNFFKKFSRIHIKVSSGTAFSHLLHVTVRWHATNDDEKFCNGFFWAFSPIHSALGKT